MELRLLDTACQECNGPVYAKRADKKYCESCVLIVNRRRHKLDKQRYRAIDPVKTRLNYRKWQIKTTYNITWEQYQELLEAQKHKCAICKSANLTNKDWHIDHDHKTNKVRGILCNNCNLMLGKAKDNINVLKSAIEYLQEHSA